MASNFIGPLTSLLQISLWTIPLAGLSGLCGAYLQAKDRFFLTAAGTLIINIILIISLLYYQKNPNILYILSIAVLIGALMRYLAQGVYILKLDFLAQPSNFTPPPALRATSPRKGGRDLGIRYFESMASGSILILLPFIARSFASFHGHGAIASFNYAIKLIDLPYAIGLASFAVVLLPKLSDLFKQTHAEVQAIKIAQEGLLIMWILSLSFTIVLFWFAQPLVQIVYGWGRITSENLFIIAGLFKWGILGLPAMGFNTLLTAIFNAKQNTRTPFLIYLFCFLIFLILNFLLIKFISLLGIISILVLINWLIVFLQFYFLKFYYSIDLYKKIFSLDFIKVIFIHTLIFIPVVYLSFILNKPSSAWTMLALAMGSGVFLLLGGILIIDKYRVILLDFIK